ncbi:MAG TPA: hypothetical protein VGA70_05175 [Longimicrobiales bacterium]
MKARRRILLVPACGAALVVVVVVATALLHPPLRRQPGVAAPLEWVGALHTHTDASHDGGGTLEQLVGAATGLDFVLVSDHNVRGLPGSRYHGALLLVAGEEVSSPHGHLVVVGERAVPASARDPDAGPVEPALGLRIAAHPMGRRRWTAWEEGYFDAMEIWNADSERRGDGALEWIHALALVPLRPVAGLYRLLDHPVRNLMAWDLLTRTRHVAGVCGVDAHNSLPLPLGLDLHFPAYRHSLALARQHVFLASPPTGEAAADAALVAEALRRGRSFCAFSGLGDARGAAFSVRSGENTAALGETIAWSPGAALVVTLPPAGAEATLRLIRDGRVVAEGRGPSWRAALPGPGVYRVEAFLEQGRTVPWILTNPVWVVGDAMPGGEAGR